MSRRIELGDGGYMISHADVWERLLRMAEEEALTEVASDITREAINTAPIFVGNLRRTIAFQKPAVEGALLTCWVGFIGGHADAFRYAMAVEKGRRAGKKPPPIESLLLWVERKLKIGMVGTTNATTRKTTWRRDRSGDSGLVAGRSYSPEARRAVGRAMGDDARAKKIRSVAFLVARKIGKEGTKPQPFLLPAYDKHIGKLFPLLQRKVDSLKSMLPQ